MKQGDCPECTTSWLVGDHEKPICPSCGYGGFSVLRNQHHSRPYSPAWNGQNSAPSVDRAVLGLVLNILILPGLGTIVSGRKRLGYFQVGTLLAGWVLTVIVIGVLVIFGAWLWALVTGIETLGQARRAETYSRRIDPHSQWNQERQV